jgi:hypothetical protein
MAEISLALAPPIPTKALRHSKVERRNPLIVGGTSSGKTTLANALLAATAHLDERVILLTDTREPQCAAPDPVALRTEPGVIARRPRELPFRPIRSSSARSARRGARHAEGVEHWPFREKANNAVRLGNGAVRSWAGAAEIPSNRKA